jgi:stage III sporulation protein AA
MSDTAVSHLIQYLPVGIKETLLSLNKDKLNRLLEIRLRRNKPLMIVTDSGDYFLEQSGETKKLYGSFYINDRDMEVFFNILTNSSVYTFEDEIKKGFITLPGGHRVGFVGQVVIYKDEIQTIKHISGFNIRIAREVLGASKGIIRYIFDFDGVLKHSLIISPPKGGKTTILRDIAREISNGIKGIIPLKVCIIDERSEIAGCYNGVPQLNVGLRTDVLDNCPKAYGMMMVLRSMSPDVIITDELGRPEDVKAVREVINCGAKIIATAHGNSYEELKARPYFNEMFQEMLFERVIVISSREGPGTIEEIRDGFGKKMNFRRVKECSGLQEVF